MRKVPAGRVALGFAAAVTAFATVPTGAAGATATSVPSTTAAIVRASLGPLGVQADDNIIDRPSISANGRYVTFASAAGNLVERDTENWIDIFVRDQLTQTTKRISLSPSGEQADGASFAPVISADGRYIAYDSYATNLTRGDDNDKADVFLYDTVGQTTRRVSTNDSGGTADGDSTGASISANGRYVSFDSTAADIVPGDTNGSGDVFVWDSRVGRSVRASIGAARDGSPTQGNAGSGLASISADGSRVAFVSAARNLRPGDTNQRDDVYVRDLRHGKTERVSVGSRGTQGTADADGPALSADGNHVAFQVASRLSPEDHDWTVDVYVRDLRDGTTDLASAAITPTPRGAERGVSYGPSISGDGRYVAFTSFANDLVPGDLNMFQEIYLRDMKTNVLTRPAVSAAGEPGTASSYGSALTPSGAHLAFGSAAANLVEGDTNHVDDTFVRALPLATVAAVGRSAQDVPPPANAKNR